MYVCMYVCMYYVCACVWHHFTDPFRGILSRSPCSPTLMLSPSSISRSCYPPTTEEVFVLSPQVLWFSNVPTLKEVVFLRPSWLFDVLKGLFRHDLENVSFTPDDTLKVIGFTPTKFERLKAELVTEGVVDKELVKGLLVSLMPADISKPSLEVSNTVNQ